MLFVFNFHPDKSYQNYKVGTFWKSDHFILMESDSLKYGGHKRLDDANGKWFQTINEQKDKRPYALQIYLPSRSVIVFCPYEVAQRMASELPEMPAPS